MRNRFNFLALLLFIGLLPGSVCAQVGGSQVRKYPSIEQSLSIFIDEQDISLLVARVNTDPEIAFIALDGLLSDR